jgi:hypothetical protein
VICIRCCNAIGFYCPGGHAGGADPDQLACPYNAYCIGGSAEPVTCPINSLNILSDGSTMLSDCHCNNGYYLTNGVASTADDYCTLCSAPYYCVDNPTAPLSCLSGSSTYVNGATSIDNCTCDNGMQGNGGNVQCTICDAGYICNHGEAPLPCPIDYYCEAGTWGAGSFFTFLLASPFRFRSQLSNPCISDILKHVTCTSLYK